MYHKRQVTQTDLVTSINCGMIRIAQLQNRPDTMVVKITFW